LVPKAALMVPETKRPALESDVSQLSLSPTTTVPESLVMELKATVLVMTSAITMSKVSTAVKPAASVRVTVTLVVPATVGVPLKVPVVALNVNQLGSVEVV
jgi:hypothetical protein